MWSNGLLPILFPYYLFHIIGVLRCFYRAASASHVSSIWVVLGHQNKYPLRLPLAPEAWLRPRYGAFLMEEVIGSLNDAF